MLEWSYKYGLMNLVAGDDDIVVSQELAERDVVHDLEKVQGAWGGQIQT